MLLVLLPLITLYNSLKWYKRNYNLIKTSDDKNSKKFKGLVLFDIDGTLTTGKNNEAVVQLCIDNDWAVGICTAGSIYSMENLLNYDWMPRNLYDFIVEHNNITFNNVSSEYLMGKLNKDAYTHLHKYMPIILRYWYPFVYGFRKGFALTETAKALGIENGSLILCDDLRIFIEGALTYNNNIKIVCAGEDCGGELSIKALENVINLI